MVRYRIIVRWRQTPGRTVSGSGYIPLSRRDLLEAAIVAVAFLLYLACAGP
jgi:hypothetical protein